MSDLEETFRFSKLCACTNKQRLLKYLLLPTYILVYLCAFKTYINKPKVFMEFLHQRRAQKFLLLTLTFLSITLYCA